MCVDLSVSACYSMLWKFEQFISMKYSVIDILLITDLKWNCINLNMDVKIGYL